jgi:Uncharacterised nucleotidyltransferase
MYRTGANFATSLTEARTAATVRDVRSNREAALLSLCHPDSEHLDRLLHLSGQEWRKLLYWLDVSGISLYLAHQLFELNLEHAISQEVGDRFHTNLIDNRVRIRHLLQESAEIQGQFQTDGLSYAVLKGFSLYPSSVPNPELRHQLDLDFLIGENSAGAARHILERAGYRLHGITGRTWEFKKNETPRFSTAHMYKDGFGFTVELHLDSIQMETPSRLSRLEFREIEGISMPVLSPADLFLGQGLHVFKDLCSPFMRAAHVLEFYRHLCTRSNDRLFWSDVRALAISDSRSTAGVGVVLLLMHSVLGFEIPEEVSAWTTCRIPVGVRRWLGKYGRRAVYGAPPGTKLYLLLQRELETEGIPFHRTVKSALLPGRIPAPIFPAKSDETLAIRVRRYALQARYVLMRARFHLVEGVRFVWESSRWKRTE